MKPILLTIMRWFEKMFCQHKNKTVIFIDYQDRYVRSICDNCGKFIYEDL